MRSDNTFVPPVTELLSPPDSRITGADSPVMALSSIVARPSMISPSVGMVSPASQTNKSPFFSCEEEIFSPLFKVAGVSSLVFRKLSACAFPRASAIASAKLANNSVNKSTRNTTKLYPKLPCDVSPVNVQIETNSITIVPISTVNITGFLNSNFGFNFTKDCTNACCTISF